MKLRLNKNDMPLYFIYPAIILYFSYYFINNSYIRDLVNMNILTSVANIMTVLLLLMSIITQKVISFNRLAFYAVVFAFFLLINRYQSNLYTLLIIILFMFAGTSVNRSSVLKCAFKVQIFWLILIILLASIGIIDNVVSTNSLFHDKRVYLGFTAPVAPTVLYFSFLTYLGFQEKKIKKIELLFFLVAAVILYNQSDVTAAFFFTVITIIISFLLNQIPEKFWRSNACSIMISLVYPICVVFTFILPILYIQGNSLVQQLNTFTSSRIYQSAQALQTYGIRLFGQVVNFNYGLSGSYYNSNDVYSYIDGSYLKYLIMYGIVFMAIVLVAYYRMAICESRRGNGYIVLAVISSAAYFIFNPQMMYIAYNPYLILLFAYLFKKATQFEDTDAIVTITSKNGT